MPTTRVDPYRGFNFIVELDGINQASFQECSGLDAITDPVDYREGKDPNHVRKLTGLNKYSPITLKRGITDSDELWKWRQTVIDGKTERKNGSVVLLDETGTEKLRWNFSNAWPSKWTGPAFNATGNTVAVETLELTHEEVKKGMRPRVSNGDQSPTGHKVGIADRACMRGNAMLQTEFAFTLPMGYVDPDGNLHRDGTMRLATAFDEIAPLKDPRVQSNPAYLLVILLARVITRLGSLEHINPKLIESLYAADLAFLQDLYGRINSSGHNRVRAHCPHCDKPFEVELDQLGIWRYPLERLYEEVAYVAFHFHWPHEQILSLEHGERQRWVAEMAKINRRLNEEREGG